ncbi:MAG: Fic family protein [Patescibacteria group bacterium]
MDKLTKNQQLIILLFLKNGNQQSSGVHDLLLKSGEKTSLVTVKRSLSEMSRVGFLEVSGFGRSTVYKIAVPGRFSAEINAKEYCFGEPDKRFGDSKFNFNLLEYFKLNPFQKEEKNLLEVKTLEYGKKIKNLSPAISKKELERFVIELSWKSSKIEGNTYTLLDTEKLLIRGEKAAGHGREEAQMILNHKEAFNLVFNNVKEFKKLTKVNMREVHKLLVKNLNVKTGWRSSAVGVAGSKYMPLDNRFQIEEAVESFIASIGKQKDPYAKAFFALLGISYIQPFEDGNKRTGRLIANAILLANNLAPLSYRSVEESDYREATLVFYELNSIQPFKKIFLEQYKFAAENYSVKKA